MDTTVILGTATTGGKIHMGYKGNQQQLCLLSSTLTNVVADLPESGQEPTIAVLLANKIAPSRLCGNCFDRLFRFTYTKRHRDTKTAARA